MSKKLHFIQLSLLAATLAVFVSCREQAGTDRPVVVVQTFCNSEDYLRKVEEMCPDIEIKWWLSVQSYSNLYSILPTTPDILTRASYLINEDVSHLRDISDRVNMENYSRNLIENFRYEDGSIYWYPALGSSFCILANMNLFDKYGIELPHDYQSLIAADKAFKQHGIDGISWGLGNAWQYQTLAVAQLLSADIFNSYTGMAWREKYSESLKNGGDYLIDRKMWATVIQRMKDAYDIGLIDDDDLTIGNVEHAELFTYDKVAMIFTRTNIGDSFYKNVAMVPAFDANGQAWVPVNIIHDLGISKNVSDERMPAVMKVFDAMTSAEALKIYNDSRYGAVPMNNDSDCMDERMERLKEPVQNGYTFLTFQEHLGGLVEGFFETVHTGLSGHDIDAALDHLEKNIAKFRVKPEHLNTMNSDDPDRVLFTSDSYYPITTGPDHNNPTTSCLGNSILEAINSNVQDKYDIAVFPALFAGAPITKGNYYWDENGKDGYTSNIGYLFSFHRVVYPATMTVAQLMQAMNTHFHSYTRIDDGMPVMAGASYKVKKYSGGIAEEDLPFTPNNANCGIVANVKNYPQCYICTAICRDGKELPPDMELRVLISRECAFYMTEHSDKYRSQWAGLDPALTYYGSTGERLNSYYDFLIDWIRTGHTLCPPSKYVEITDAN